MRMFVAELVGTAIFVGAFALLRTHIPVGASWTDIGWQGGMCLAFGILISLVIDDGAGQLNPAVTFLLLLLGRISRGQAIANIVAQFVGASFATFLLQQFYTRTLVREVLIPGPVRHTSGWAAFSLEGLGSLFLLGAVAYYVVKSSNSWAPFAVGLGLTLAIWSIGPVTGAAVNPARLLGPALVLGSLRGDMWIYLGPILAAFVFKPFVRT